MADRNWSGEGAIEPPRREGMWRRGAGTLVRRGVQGKVLDSSAQVAEKYLPRQLSRAFVLTQVALVTRWVRLIEWGALALLILFGGGGLWLFVAHNDNFFSTFLLAFALIFLGVWWLTRKSRRFAEQQVRRALSIFQGLVQNGEVPESAWPTWFRQWKRRNSQL